MRTPKAALTIAALSLSLFFVPALAHADDTSKVAAATVLFDEGVRLMESGQIAEACTKLSQSHELAPSGGTLLALGECYEKLGRVASAWLVFREAAARASAAGKRDAEAKALDRVAKLERRLPKMTITAKPGIEVRRDGAVLSSAELGLATPIDPGTHEVRASAPGKKPFVKLVDVTEGVNIGVEIPPLESDSAGGSPVRGPDGETPPPETPSEGSTQRILGLGVAGLGIAAVGVGAAFGLMAKADNDEALQRENCRTSELCTQRGLDLTEDAKSKALVSTILFIAGGVAVAGGAALFFTAPSASAPKKGSAPSLRFLPVAGPTGFGGAASLTF